MLDFLNNIDTAYLFIAIFIIGIIIKPIISIINIEKNTKQTAKTLEEIKEYISKHNK